MSWKEGYYSGDYSNKIFEWEITEVKLLELVLKSSGKKTFVQAFEDRLEETIAHRTLNRSVSYKHLIKLECYKLQKHFLEIEEYKPFKMWW